ncbi:aromatase/cyclase [Spongiactinospora rosea]|uniref:aromatase/cyclase n=1 Tax=Spongiactinospora rosea TaxID=2248750 RepID=UPI001CEDC302|nr:aromatase/cyclase [Spongiactinospora rosea]
MTGPGRHHTTHRIDIAAPADVVYGLIADAAAWPLRFTPSIHVERLPLGGAAERLRIWALANGEVTNWTSHRELDARRRRITFRQERSSPPVASMGGEWIVEQDGSGTRLTFDHDFDVVDDDPAGLAWVNRAVDGNSKAELANLKQLAEAGDREAAGLEFSFEDSVLVKGSADTVYEFLYRAKRWPDRLPHVRHAEVGEDVENIQSLRMETSAKDGSVHTTESIRICFPDTRRIVYKQTVTPPLMAAHTGEWTVHEPAGESGGGVLVTSRHTVLVNEANIGRVLGEGATAEKARKVIRDALGGNSMATLTLAKAFAEADHA